MLVDKQRKKDIIDCINEKVRNGGNDKEKVKLIIECYRYFNGLTKNDNLYEVEDEYVFTEDRYINRIYIFIGDMGYKSISAFGHDRIEKWGIEYIQKFYDNCDNILMKIAEKYGCENNTLLTNRKRFRFF
jgi:hypothetical protein